MANQVHPEQATAQLAEQGAGSLPVQAIHFQKVDGYTTFNVEYAVSEGDLIFHFYVTAEIQKLKSPQDYWYKLFPSVLDVIARDHFKVEFPRLKAAYTEEKASWWMRAFGFGGVLEPHKLAHGFFDKLDAALEEAQSKSST